MLSMPFPCHLIIRGEEEHGSTLLTVLEKKKIWHGVYIEDGVNINAVI